MYGISLVSLLGTWEGRGVETWNPASSNLYQVNSNLLASLLGNLQRTVCVWSHIISLANYYLYTLVDSKCARPYIRHLRALLSRSRVFIYIIYLLDDNIMFTHYGYNHVYRYDKHKGTVFGERSAQLYNESAFLLCIRAMIQLMDCPPAPFHEYILSHFERREKDIRDICEYYLASQPEATPDIQQPELIEHNKKEKEKEKENEDNKDRDSSPSPQHSPGGGTSPTTTTNNSNNKRKKKRGNRQRGGNTQNNSRPTSSTNTANKDNLTLVSTESFEKKGLEDMPPLVPDTSTATQTTQPQSSSSTGTSALPLQHVPSRGFTRTLHALYPKLCRAFDELHKRSK